MPLNASKTWMKVKKKKKMKKKKKKKTAFALLIYSFFDVGDCYKGELFLSQFMRGDVAKSRTRVICTKLG